MAMQFRFPKRADSIRLCLLLLAVIASGMVEAATLVVSPASGHAGTTVKVTAGGLSPATSYTLEFVGSPATNIATLTTNALGAISTTRVLPALPPGGGKMRLKTGTLGGTVVAYTAFTALPGLTFTPQASTIHAGQSIRYTVQGLVPGTVTVQYEDLTVAGPIAVSRSSYSGRFAVPTDRPASLPANARIRVLNNVGRVVANELNTTMAVQPRLSSPFTIGINQAPPTQPRAGQRFNIAGALSIAANEAPPDNVSLWYFGSNGEVFPMGAAEPVGAGATRTYAFEGTAPGMLSMTAGRAAAGQTRLVGTSNDTYGRPVAQLQSPPNAAFNQLPQDRWRIRVRVRKPDGTPIPGAIVQVENAPVAEPDSGIDFGALTVAGYLGRATSATQFATFQATDAQGCPITLARKIADANGNVDFEFLDEDLALNFILQGECNAGGSCDLNAVPRTVRLAIDASAQGYGFQFTEGPNAFDFLPHIYEVQFIGAGDGDLGNDEVHFIDWYQQVEVLTGDRDTTFTLPLPPITPKVALFDVAIKPWVAVGTSGAANSGDQSWGSVRQVFGPINSLPTTQPYASWVQIVAGEDYPTEITVRTDPAVSGVIQPGNARLFLDMNRNGDPEFIGNFSASANDLDCTIDGLDKALTWRATLPPGLKSAASGRINGYVQFVGQPNTGQASKKIGVDMVRRDLGWLAASRYSGQRLYYRYGGQRLAIEAVEDTQDAAVQLPSDPGYSIGRLRNETNNQRLVSIAVDSAGNDIVSAPLDGTHKEAGRNGDPTTVEAAAGVTYGPDTTTLIDQSFPLFYYVWGVPLLAGIEVGADFSLLADITIQSRFDLTAQKEPRLTMTTTPGLDLGLNFYLDLDVLFDLVDGGVDLDAIFELDMPIRVVNGNPQPPDPDFNASLLFSWHFEVFCLPLDVICDAINDIEGCERLLPPNDNRPCFANGPLAPSAPSGGDRARTIPRLWQTAVAYSRNGAGLMAFTRDDSAGAAPPKLIVRPVDGSDFGRVTDETVLSTAPGIRSVALEYYQDERAVAVWAESADTYATLAARTPAQRIARQRLMYALWDGENWTAKASLTPVSGGEGGVDLAGCDPGTDSGCPAGGEVLAVWTRDMAGDIFQHRTRIYSSRYSPARGWTTPQAVDGSALLDSAPSAAYVAAVPAVAFVRSTSGVFADTDSRRVAYRFLQTGTTVQVPAGLPGGVAWPSMVGTPDGGFAIAHTYANDPQAFVGNRQRVAMAYANACAAGTCSVVAQAVTDANGRPVYGERPTALLDNAGNVSVVMRGTGFGAGTNGVQQLPDDPIGMVAHTGELITFATARGQAVITPQGLSNDGAAHFAPAAAYDPELGVVVALGTRSSALPRPFRAKLASAGARGQAARAAAAQAEGEMLVYSAEQGVDFSIESLTATATNLSAGGTFQATVRLRNAGADYVAQSPFWQMVLSFDAPYEAGGANVGGRFVPSLKSGQSVALTSTVTVPAGFSPDQMHRLYARVYRAGNSVADVNGANDQAHLDFGGMPMPFGLSASAVPGSGFVQLAWDPIADPAGLIAGYRIWCHDGDGEWRHLGSSFNLGFLDLAAPIGVERHYRVTSYSRNAIESAPSTEAVATALRNDGLFANGFE